MRIFVVCKRQRIVLKTSPSRFHLAFVFMLRKLLALVLVTGLSVGMAGCKKEKTQAELQAEKAKVFREKQKKAAAQAYQDLVDKYPDSPYAEQAKQKVQELGGVPAKTPEKK
jgi:hypothetical protein